MYVEEQRRLLRGFRSDNQQLNMKNPAVAGGVRVFLDSAVPLMPNSLERIDHVNLVVDDVETMIRFYRDVLGLRLTKQATIRGKWIDAVTGLADVVADVAFLEISHGPGIELLRYRTPQGPRPAGLGHPNAKGLRHLAFRVRDIDRLAAAIEAAGFPLVSEVQQVPAEQVDYADVRKRLVYCHDPEGNLLELCAYEAGDPGCVGPVGNL